MYHALQVADLVLGLVQQLVLVPLLLEQKQGLPAGHKRKLCYLYL